MTSPASTIDPVSTLSIRAPRVDLGVVCVPGNADAAEQIVRQVSMYDDSNLLVAGGPFVELRKIARRELLDAAIAYSADLTGPATPAGELRTDVPFVLCGHQPQLTHPGVWAKNVIASQLAKLTDGIAINIVVDNDTIRSRSIVVPVDDSAEHDGKTLKHAFISFDYGRSKVPWEDVVIEDATTFAAFEDNVLKQFAGTRDGLLLCELWPATREYAEKNPNLRDVLTFLRRRFEQAGGLKLLDVPLSSLCELGSFRPFFTHLLKNAETFASIHNDALREYRLRNKITQSHVPFRDLELDGEWIETPFWIWHVDLPVRRALFVKHEGDQVLLSDRGRFHTTMSEQVIVDDALLAAELEKVNQSGWKIRTRAVSTTMLSRLFLGDYFIHGIGGAKYDEITDQIIREFWQLPVPSYQVVTATAYLPLTQYENDCGDIGCDIDQWHRDWLWNPAAFFDVQGQLVEPWNNVNGVTASASPQAIKKTLADFEQHLESLEPAIPIGLISRQSCASKECYHRKQQRKADWHQKLSELKSDLRKQTGITEADWSRWTLRRRRVEQNRVYASYREYPYVLFTETKMDQLKSVLIEG